MYLHGTPPRGQRSGGRLQEAHHTQAGLPVREWLAASLYTFQEVESLDMQCFSQAHLGSVHVSSPIVDQEFVDSSGSIIQRDSPVVDLDLLTRLHVVVNNHLATAANQRATDLDGR